MIMSTFHNEHLVGEYQTVCDKDGNCYAIGVICQICKEDVSWIMNRK